MRLIDTHSHLFLEEFSEDLPQVIERARSAGVTHIFMPNIDSTTIDSMLSVCNTYNDYCFPMIGLHPTSVNADYEKDCGRADRYKCTVERRKYLGGSDHSSQQVLPSYSEKRKERIRGSLTENRFGNRQKCISTINP